MALLRASLVVLSIALVAGPIAYGLYLYNWDFTAFVMPQVGAGGFVVGGAPAISFKNFTVTKFSQGVLEATLYLSVSNNLSADVLLENITFDVYCNEHGLALAHAFMESGFKVPARGEADVPIKIAGTFDGFAHVLSEHASTYVNPVSNRTIYSVNMYVDAKGGAAKLKMYEVEIRVPFEYLNLPLVFEHEG